jgi:hypothetical protein
MSHSHHDGLSCGGERNWFRVHSLTLCIDSNVTLARAVQFITIRPSILAQRDNNETMTIYRRALCSSSYIETTKHSLLKRVKYLGVIFDR